MLIIPAGCIRTPPGEVLRTAALHDCGPPSKKRSISMPQPIALKLRSLREQRGLTQKEAAQLADVSELTVYRLESGKQTPYMPTVTKIARAYGVPLEELLEEE
jgi:DNA-binding XRE family transcriptional regulator